MDLEAWQKYLGFVKNSAYAEMSIDIDLVALALKGSFSEVTTQAPTETHFKRDLLGEVAGEVRRPGPLLRLPSEPTRIVVDPPGLVH